MWDTSPYNDELQLGRYLSLLGLFVRAPFYINKNNTKARSKPQADEILTNFVRRPRKLKTEARNSEGSWMEDSSKWSRSGDGA